MSCYVEGGRPTIVVQGSSFTFEFNAASGFWNERQSPTLARWRCSRSVFFENKWLFGDIASSQILQVSAAAFDELGSSFIARLESGPVKQYLRAGRSERSCSIFHASSPVSGVIAAKRGRCCS